MTIDEYQHPQPHHKQIPRDKRFFDEKGQQITYKNSHDATAAETCNDFYPIHCQQCKDLKILRLRNDGENFSLNSISTDLAHAFSTASSRMFPNGKTLNNFRRLCRPESAVSLSPPESSPGTYSSLRVTETAGNEETGPFSHVELIVHEDCDIDDDDAYVCGNNVNDHYRLCEARAAHDSVLSDPDTLIAKKAPSATAAPHLRTQDLINMLDNVAKVVDLDVPAIFQKKLKDPVLNVVRSWIQEAISPHLKAPAIRQYKGLLRYSQEVDRLLAEEHGQLLLY